MANPSLCRLSTYFGLLPRPDFINDSCRPFAVMIGLALTPVHRNRLARLFNGLPCTAGAKGAKLDQARRLQIERKAEVDSGWLLQVEEVAKVWSEVVRNAKAVLLAIPTRAAPDLLRSTSLKEIEDKLRGAIHGALDVLSSPPLTKPVEDSLQTV